MPKNNLYFFYGHYAYLKEKTDEFEILLEKLYDYADFINFEDAIELLKNGNINHFDKPTICFSFDDGFKECYTHIYPVLKKYNVNACFFINPNFIDGSEEYINKFQEKKIHIKKEPMTKEMVREMSQDGFLFGSHTCNHANIATLDYIALVAELEESKKWLENLLSLSCDYFAWPYGTMNHINDSAIKAASQRYKYIFSALRDANYFCCDNRQVINRDHFEGFWHESHVRFFLSKAKKINITQDKVDK